MSNPSQDAEIVKDRLQQFMQEHIYPQEQRYHEELNALPNRFATVPLMEELKSQAERAGLWKEVKDRLNEPGTGLSGGQQQRLCIARAIATKPDVILMDEPCSALDPIATAIVEELIHELRLNYTIVIVTHSMQQAARVSQRTAFFHLGYLVEEGETGQIFTNPVDARTQDYIMGRTG